MTEINARVAEFIDDAFRKNVRQAARACWTRVSGGETVDESMREFSAALASIKTLRDRQLKEATKIFGG